MKNRALFLVVSLSTFVLVVAQQEQHSQQLIVPLARGGFVAFRSERAWANTSKSSSQVSQEAQGGLSSQALIDDRNIIHRLLQDGAGETVFGYDLLIEPNADAKQFKVVVTPLDPQFASTLNLANPDGHRTQAKSSISTLPKAGDPQVLDDGDAFALDLLINHTTGVKIVDIVKVSFDRTNLWEINPRTLPRDFTLDAVELAIKDYRLVLNGEVVGVGKASRNYAGTLIWVYLENHGRFIFSLTPREGYEFRKVGVIEDDKILFALRGNQYELISAAPVLRGGGTWNLWVLHDKTYTPLLPDPEPSARKRNGLEKLDAAVQAAKDRGAKIRSERRTTLGNLPEENESKSRRLRLLIGTANRMDDLLPKP